jgi:hypothetical protein
VTASRGVVHVRNDSANGRAVERAQAAMVRWHERGYSVGPRPGDGQGHPYDTPCLVCGPAPDQLAALRAVADWEARGEPWPTSGMIDALTAVNSTPVLAPLHKAGLVRRAHYGRRYIYQLADPGRDAINRAENPDA